MRLRVVFWVQVDLAYRIGEEISPPDQLSADGDILTDVPSKGGAGERESLGLPAAGFESRKFVFPRRERDRAELIVCRRKGDRVTEVMGKQVLDFLFALLSPLGVNGEIYESPTSFFG